MDFDDLEDAEASLGPSPQELRKELLAKQVPENMPGARKHPKPPGKGYGGGTKKLEKVLYLHGPGSNMALCERQVAALFKNVPFVADFKIFEWHFLEGEINNKVEEIHADPAVAALFIPYGNKCGDTYDGFMSYVLMMNESHNNETCLGPAWREKLVKEQSLPSDGYGFEDVIERLAKFLEETGPYDGICGFDMGAYLALQAARFAQDADPRFEGKFRYLMLFSARGPRALSGLSQGAMRPKAPLQIPCFIGWSLEDDSKQYSNYEDLALYVHPNYRGVFYHDQGHRPPNIQKGTPQCNQLDAFVSNMQADISYKIAQTEEVGIYKNYWLPLLREPLPKVPTGIPRKLFVVVDPLGEHGPKPEEAVSQRPRFPAQERAEICAKRLAVYNFVTGTTVKDFADAAAAAPAGEGPLEVVTVEYLPAHRGLQWHPKVEARDTSVAYSAGQGRSRWLQAEDEVVLPWADARRVAEELLPTLEGIDREMPFALVGLGTGAHVAFALTEAILRVRQATPTRLFAVCPPTVWPVDNAPELGQLVTTPVRYLTCPQSVAGPPWRLETSTFGQFSHSHFEDKATMVQLIISEMQKLSEPGVA